jgi:hypothetical protein
MGFVDATCTMEIVRRDANSQEPVGIAAPEDRMKIHQANGMIVVIDENGHKWVTPEEVILMDYVEEHLKYFKLHRKEVHVPHSEDDVWRESIWPYAFLAQQEKVATAA